MQDATPALLTFDLGTTRLKAALFDRRGQLLGQRSARNDEYRDGDRAWQDADQWWANAVRLGSELCAAVPCDVQGIATSGRAGAAVFIGRDGTVIGQPWSDARHRGELKALLAGQPVDAVRTHYAHTLLAKKLWFVANEPKRARGLRHVLYAKDLLVYRLTGQAATDPSSGPDALQWDADLLARASAESLVPRSGLPWSLAGKLTPTAARALGLRAGIPVAIGAHDGVCANYGAGAAFPGAWVITLGTNAVVRAVTATHPPGANRFYTMPPGRHAIGASGVMVGRSPDWFLDLIYGRDDRARTRHLQQLDRAADALPVGSEGVRFLPFLNAQIAPKVRGGAHALFHGMRAEHGRDVLYRAVLEGAACAVRSLFAQIEGWCGEPQLLRLTGSGATSRVWAGMLANLLDRPLEVSDNAVEGRGAAMTAAVALGWYTDMDIAGIAMAQVRRTIRPDPAKVGAWAQLYSEWRALDEATKALDR